MRKLTFFLAATMVAAGASAQLRVVSNGQVQMGTASTSTGGISVGSGSTASSSADSLASVRIIGNGSYESGGRIAFGNCDQVSIGETAAPTGLGTKGTSGLQLKSRGPLTFTNGSKNIISYDPTTAVAGATGTPVSFSVPVSATQYLTVSDSRSKTDIEPLEDVGLRLGEIAPVSYHLIGNDTDTPPENSPMRSNASNGNGDSHPQYGFLAQDVREVYPELVYEDSDGNLSLDYIGFIPILVDAVQHLQATVAEQAALIETLQNPQDGDATDNGSAVVAGLGQNRPNPFRVSTEIACVIPEDAGNAFLCVYDLNGNQKLRTDITERGNVTVTIEGNRLSAGMYIYTLIIDGNEIDSKRMILTD